MTDKELKLIGEWLNTKGYDIDLKDSFWMEDFVTEHKFRDLAQLLMDYRTDLVKFSLAPVSLAEQSESTVCQYCEGTGKDGHDRCDPPNWYTCEHCEGSGKL